MTNRFLSYFLVVGSLIAVLAACRKNNVDELGDAGRTFVKIMESPSNTLFFEPYTGSKPAALFSLRREANSETQLNTPLMVTVRLDTAAVRAYNAANNNTFELLPDSLFTLGAGVTKTGNLTYQLSLQPGEFAKDFMISLNGSKWDLSRKYAMPFTILDPGGMPISTGKEKVISLISIKNKYDGIYSVESGNVLRYTAPGAPEPAGGLNGSLVGNPDVTLSTVGPNTVLVSNIKWAFTNGGGVGGIDPLQATIDPATNQVTMRSGINTTLTNWAGKDNRYDPATKTFYLAFRWNPTSTTREYEIVLKYKKPR